MWKKPTTQTAKIRTHFIEAWCATSDFWKSVTRSHISGKKIHRHVDEYVLDHVCVPKDFEFDSSCGRGVDPGIAEMDGACEDDHAEYLSRENLPGSHQMNGLLSEFWRSINCFMKSRPSHCALEYFLGKKGDGVLLLLGRI